MVEQAKHKKLWVHACVMLALMVVFHVIPPLGVITEVGRCKHIDKCGGNICPYNHKRRKQPWTTVQSTVGCNYGSRYAVDRSIFGNAVRVDDLRDAMAQLDGDDKCGEIYAPIITNVENSHGRPFKNGKLIILLAI